MRDVEDVFESIDYLIEESEDCYSDTKETYYLGGINALKRIKKLLNQLDEPEVLSQEWIDNNSIYASSDGVTEEYVHVDDLQNLLLPKQDVSVVPTWFDEWWEDVTKGGGSLFHNIERFYDELFSSGTRETYNYISDPDNKKKLLNIIVNELDYVVEKEQKYYVLDSEEIPLLERANNQTCKTTTGLSIYEDGRDNSRFELTEQEIKGYDDRFWPFAVKVEEMEE